MCQVEGVRCKGEETRRTTAVHRTASGGTRDTRRIRRGAVHFRTYYITNFSGTLQYDPILILSLEYSRDIRGVFVEYTWDIRMYRLCVGYVSGMYRESIER